MNDKELLELAAKAAGIDAVFVDTDHEKCFKVRYETEHVAGYRAWNPLEDSGDALELAVKLQIEITTYPKTGEVGAGRSANLVGYGRHGRVFEYFGGDPYEATRRCITRAAAEIGRNME